MRADTFSGAALASAPAPAPARGRASPQTPATGHQVLARALRASGISHLYGIAAVPVVETFGACAAQGVRTIGTRHQASAVLMAVAQNYQAGRQCAVALVSPGAAATNALTGVLVAHDNAWPVVVLAGAVPRADPRLGQFMALDAVALLRPVTKSAVTADSADAIPAALAQALQVACFGRPGPVLVELPADVLNGLAAPAGALPAGDLAALLGPAAASPAELPDASRSIPTIPANTLDEVVERLQRARRPLLVLGKGARWSSGFTREIFREFVDRLALPFVTSPIARGFVPDGHPLCFNAVTWAAQREADVVVVVGARLDWTFRYGTSFAADATIIHVDVHAEEFERNRPAGMRVAGDAGEFVSGVLARVARAAPAARAPHGAPSPLTAPAPHSAPPGSLAPDASATARDTAWIADLQKRREATVRDWEDEAMAAGLPLSPDRLALELGRAIPDDALTIFDANVVMASCQRHVLAHRPLSRLTPGSGGCLGTGIPFAIGARMNEPGRPVVAICGDFAFGLSALELETAVRHNVPIVVVVANNDGNSGSLRQKGVYPAGYPERVSMYQPGLRYDRLAAELGAHAEHVERPEELAPALRRALACGRAACVNVVVDPDAQYPRG